MRQEPPKRIGLLRAISIVVGIIIGAGIFEAPPFVAACAPNEAWLQSLWLFGALLSFLGALCYAELATTYPEDGGDYVFLRRSFGAKVGFVFSWARIALIQPASIGAVAFCFGDYATGLYDFGPHSSLLYALLAVGVLTLLNMLGVREGMVAQVVLTVAKVMGILALCVAGLAVDSAGHVPTKRQGDLVLALVFVLWTFGGWNEVAYVAGEVKNPTRNILWALVLGLAVVTGVYFLVNLVFLKALGIDGLAASKAPAAEVLRFALGEGAAKAVCVLVALSALGGTNGVIFTGARLYFALGQEYGALAVFARWRRAPIVALAIQGLMVFGLMMVLGSREGFSAMVKLTAAPFWGFVGLVSLALIVLRYKEPVRLRPWKVPLYPVTPMVVAGMAFFMAYEGLDYAPRETLLAFAVIAFGIPLYFLVRRGGAKSNESP